MNDALISTVQLLTVENNVRHPIGIAFMTKRTKVEGEPQIVIKNTIPMETFPDILYDHSQIFLTSLAPKLEENKSPESYIHDIELCKTLRLLGEQNLCLFGALIDVKGHKHPIVIFPITLTVAEVRFCCLDDMRLPQISTSSSKFERLPWEKELHRKPETLHMQPIRNTRFDTFVDGELIKSNEKMTKFDEPFFGSSLDRVSVICKEAVTEEDFSTLSKSSEELRQAAAKYEDPARDLDFQQGVANYVKARVEQQLGLVVEDFKPEEQTISNTLGENKDECLENIVEIIESCKKNKGLAPQEVAKTVQNAIKFLESLNVANPRKPLRDKIRSHIIMKKKDRKIISALKDQKERINLCKLQAYLFLEYNSSLDKTVQDPLSEKKFKILEFFLQKLFFDSPQDNPIFLKDLTDFYKATFSKLLIRLHNHFDLDVPPSLISPSTRSKSPVPTFMQTPNFTQSQELIPEPKKIEPSPKKAVVELNTPILTRPLMMRRRSSVLTPCAVTLSLPSKKNKQTINERGKSERLKLNTRFSLDLGSVRTRKQDGFAVPRRKRKSKRLSMSGLKPKKGLVKKQSIIIEDSDEEDTFEEPKPKRRKLNSAKSESDSQSEGLKSDSSRSESRKRSSAGRKKKKSSPKSRRNSRSQSPPPKIIPPSPIPTRKIIHPSPPTRKVSKKKIRTSPKDDTFGSQKSNVTPTPPTRTIIPPTPPPKKVTAPTPLVRKTRSKKTNTESSRTPRIKRVRAPRRGKSPRKRKPTPKKTKSPKRKVTQKKFTNNQSPILSKKRRRKRLRRRRT